MRRSGGVSGVSGEISVDRPIVPASRIGSTVLGSFRLKSIIGRGTFATAYLAEQLGTEREAVVKITHPELVASRSWPSVRSRFENELRALTRVRHPNVVTMFLAGETGDGLPAIAMEHVEGNAMADLLECTAGPLPLGTLDPCFHQLGSALHALHGAGIVHRDVTPSNVIVGRDSTGRPQATLLDLGMAQPRDRDTGAQLAVGTPRYIAPEQLLGKATPASDMYALGAILWWALTGKEIGEEVMRLAHDRRWGDTFQMTPDPRVDRSDLPERLAAFVGRMLSPSEHARPCAEEFVGEWPDLIAEVRGLEAVPVAASDPSARTRPMRVAPLRSPTREPPPPPPRRRSDMAVRMVSQMYTDMSEQLEPSRAPAPSQEEHARRVYAAIVDDNRVTRRFVEGYLRRHGCEVTTVEHVDDLDGLDRPPDIIFVSGHLGSDPCTAVFEIKARRPGAAVVLTAQQRIGEHWRTCGARELVIVPTNLARLGALVEEVRAAPEKDSPPKPAMADHFDIVRRLAEEDPRLMRETIEEFIGQFPEWLAQLSSGLELNNAAVCVGACREIEAAVVMVGARSLGHQAKTIRSFVDVGDLEAASGFIDDMEANYGRVFQKLMQLRREIDGTAFGR